jgi:hypothetical protein
VDKCLTCHNQYSPTCDWNQGRCPHHPPLLNIQPKDTSKGHFYVSLVKSALRVVAGGNLVLGNLFWAGTFLILAEVLGVIEELV